MSVGTWGALDLPHARGVPTTIQTNRVLERLPAVGTDRARLRSAGEQLGASSIELYGVQLDGPRLVALAAMRPDEPFVRVLREELGFAVDVEDLLLFLDDLLRETPWLWGASVVVPPARARDAGIALHPDDIWRTPRRYGADGGVLSVASPPPPNPPTAHDGAPLGPGWIKRFPNPRGEAAMMAALRDVNPRMAEAVTSLMRQLRAQGAMVELASTLRRRERGYLMWGAFYLSEPVSDADLERRLARLDALNRAWGLNIAIHWRHPQGLAATRLAANDMREAFGVVFATESGARNSNHYDGRAVDVVARRLPRLLTLVAPDGVERAFDLADPQASRDLSLTPELIDWIAAHFGMRKLLADYPHWDGSLTAHGFDGVEPTRATCWIEPEYEAGS